MSTIRLKKVCKNFKIRKERAQGGMSWSNAEGYEH